MDNNTSYETQAIDINLLSVLDITKDGKVVSAEKWVELWNLVFQHINKIDAFCVDIQSTLDNWHESEIALNEIIEDMQMKYDALSTEFIHYGENTPENPHIMLWVRRMNDVSTQGFLTNEDIDSALSSTSENPVQNKVVAEAVSSRVPKKSARPGAPFPSVIATSNGSYDEYGIPTDDSYLCIDTVGAELGKDVSNNGAFGNSIPRRDSNGNLFTGTPVDDEDCVNKKYVDDKIPDNIKNSTGSSSLQQVQDTGYTGIAIKTKNPNAYALDNTLTDNEPIGATGAFASSFGGVTSAQGKRSFTCGTNTIAKGKYSFASGDNSVALGNESFVSGFTTVAKGSQSFAIGSVTQAIGQNSVSTGNNNISNGGNSFTGGQDCITGENALRSFAYGKGLKALSNDAFVVGRFNQSGDYLFEVGNGTSDTYRDTAFSVNEYGEVWAEQLFTRLLKCGDVTINGYDVWIGDYRVLTNNDIMPIVYNDFNLNNGSGTYSIKQKENTSTAASSVALGINTQATAGASMATGVETQANGLHSFAGGNNSIAGYANQFVVGKFNSNKSDTYFEVGNGADNSNRSNAFEVYADGHAEIQQVGTTAKSVTTKKYVDDKTVVDQEFSAQSENAQSGKAVAEAVATEQKRADNTFANALKGTKSDTAIFLDDISPVAHEIEVKISSDTVTDLTAVKVKRCGSNLFDGNLIPGIYNSTDLDNTVTSGFAPKYQSIKIYLKAGTYTIASSILIRFVRTIVDGVYKSISTIGTSYTFSATTDGYCGFSFRREDNLNWDGSEKIWINVGSSAIDYEQYDLAEYTPNADGTVNGITSLYPNTTLMTDTDGVIIDCEYNRDINKAFAELQAALVSLGGTI